MVLANCKAAISGSCILLVIHVLPHERFSHTWLPLMCLKHASCVHTCRAQAARGADVYSFGVMMWELWHGKTAWQQLLDM
jgi:hypothetical protein